MKKVYLKTPEAVIKALKEGKVVKSKNVKYKLIDGIICSFHEEYGRKLWTVCNSICEYEKPYIDEPEPLKIEVGKWYETRDHQKARCFAISAQGACYSFTIDNGFVFYTYKGGKYSVEKECSLDIIGPWKEW